MLRGLDMAPEIRITVDNPTLDQWSRAVVSLRRWYSVPINVLDPIPGVSALPRVLQVTGERFFAAQRGDDQVGAAFLAQGAGVEDEVVLVQIFVVAMEIIAHKFLPLGVGLTHVAFGCLGCQSFDLT